ncbi:class I SAM-dependent methyltransferase [Rhodobacteraceae bacterium CCMM004]|nr:class I SAM-dependent methyltransferase [Rhodobacteraceae bacterium CCMM004]
MVHSQFFRLVDRLVRRGRLTVTLADGTTRRFGPGEGGPNVAVRFADPALPRKILTAPDLAVGEAYMDERLLIEDDDLRGFLELLVMNRDESVHPALDLHYRLQRIVRGLKQRNPAFRARQNVAHHYDLSSDLYDLFLDADRQYSCAYFQHPDDTLEQAQAQKKAHIAGKLRLEPGMRILDIGCGWGGMALTLAQDHGAQVVGVTLSEEQHRLARERVVRAGLEDRIDIRLSDYRKVAERFDRIVSVGMFEHVGVPHYDEYFGQVHDLLAPDGVALIHTIGRSGPPGSTSAWIDKYIFPGGYVPALSEMAAAFERAGLVATDVEVWRLHYAETLRHWHDRFAANIDRARALYDDRFCRMWRYYLLASEASFRHGPQVVFQAQLAHHRAAVPITRDYLYSVPAREGVSHAAE